MHVDIEQVPDLRVAAIRHVGPYNEISRAFERLGTIAGPAGMTARPDTKLLAIYYDNPQTTAPDELRSDAGVVVPPTTELPAGLAEERIPAGRYARTEHIGPYEQLPDVWARFLGEWLPSSGYRPGAGPNFEIYLNTPANVRPEQLVTHLYVSVA